MHYDGGLDGMREAGYYVNAFRIPICPSTSVGENALNSAETMPSWYIRLDSAFERAASDADAYGLPQTVYRNQDTCGWANTNTFAKVLLRSETFVTMLPKNYFQ